MAEYSNPNGTKNERAHLSTLRAEIETLGTDIKTLAGDVEGIADARVHDALHKAEDVARRAYRYAEDTATQASNDVEAWTDSNLKSARSSIRSQPIAALALAAGAGALTGVILGLVGHKPKKAKV
ncbi:ElaB/YqjD/DUF883 family membrane-anchored ribosome-binding protein [Rhizomicrobium palustre]|uniref:ElaB/YqjD/DUF883 family membrane-anchored ribosome-binding protein n=1 Tax=Rhizomicrobium palustre TaxID=189966 RepID=A0A846MUL1_9PROT|nr:hypothetical protein [Rhizomicrobium palustre]NIK86802.1 ElaB/YqjD/DUF883 family membrane-anchored ribosome-binding protein [Rhizomicrobium palustre]